MPTTIRRHRGAMKAVVFPGSATTWLTTVSALYRDPMIQRSATALGEFLRARRERVDPASVGLRAVGTRRTPGLRREEVAAQAGISIEYLVRLERGRDRHPSPAVVEALASALLLDEDGRRYLADLADPRSDGTAAPVDEMSDTLARLIEGWSAPTMVTNAVLDIIGFNLAGAALHEGLDLRAGDNMARELFLRPDADTVFVEFEKVAAETVGNLRALSGGGAHHPRLAALVGELSVASPVFARHWASGEVLRKTSGHKRIAHPTAGILDLEWTTLEVADAPGQLVVAYQGVPGTRAVEALLRLSSDGLDAGPNGGARARRTGWAADA